MKIWNTSCVIDDPEQVNPLSADPESNIVTVTVEGTVGLMDLNFLVLDDLCLTTSFEFLPLALNNDPLVNIYAE